MAHALKGVAGNLHAVHVEAAALALLRATRDAAGSADVAGYAARLAAELAPLIAGIRAALAAEGEATPTLDPGRAESVLARLRGMLQVGDIAASDLARQDETLLRAVLGAAGADILQRIAHFDYDGALALLPASAPPRVGSGTESEEGTP